MRAAAILIAFALVLGSCEWGQAAAQEKPAGERTAPKTPKLDAKSWVLVDADTGIYLAGIKTRLSHRHGPASATPFFLGRCCQLTDGDS